MTPKKIILHIGHGKTGSSYLQSCFAINKEKLLEFGVDYPIHESFGDAVSGKITSGNGDNFLKMLPGMEVSSERILFSNENLFHSLCRSDEFKDLLNSKDYLIEVMLYTRNLFEFQFSCWQQSIKRGGVNEDIETCLLNNPINPHHPLILAWIELSKEFNFKLRIRNYSRHKNDIAPQFFADLLGVEDFPFMPPNVNQVNRSLTYAEINFQRVFNSLGIKSRPMSDFVVDQLPNIKASEIKCSREVYDFVRGENIKLFASINKYLDPDEALEIESPEMVTFGEEHSSDYFLNGDQIDVIANYLSVKLETENAEVNTIRDIALKISKNSADSNDALSLMRIALRKRPHGIFIQKTVRNWEQNLR